MSQLTMVCAGIDTGKRKLDAAIAGGPHHLQVDNTPEGYKTLLAWLARHGVEGQASRRAGATSRRSSSPCAAMASS